MSDCELASTWLSLCEHLQALPELEEDDRVWIGRALAALRSACAARAVICALPGRDGAWERWVARADGAAVETATLAGPPRGWCGEVAAGRSAAALQAADPKWDGGGWGDQRAWLGAPVAAHEGSAAGEEGGDGVLVLVAPAGSQSAAAGGARGLAAPVEAMARLLGRALANRAQVRRLSAEVITDALTGVYNYRYLRQAVRREVRRASRFGDPLSVLMLDVDHLKEYNERFGHLQGSQVLKLLAGVLLAGTRDIDILAKYGGDEFLLILPHTDKVGAQVLADRLRLRVAARAFPPLEPGAMTCSIGVATYPQDADQPEALVAAADQALFAAKRRGRNQVCAA